MSFLIRGTLLELQTGIVDGLEKLAGALEEERARSSAPRSSGRKLKYSPQGVCRRLPLFSWNMRNSA